MLSYRASTVLGREVRFRGIRLGVIVDLLVALGTRRALGYEVLCGDEGRRFLPLAASDLAADHVEVGSALVLLDDPFYRERAQSFCALRGTVARRGAEELGLVRDIVLDDDARIVAAVLAREGRISAVRLDASVSLGGGVLRAAV